MKAEKKTGEDAEGNLAMRAPPRHDVAALQIENFTKESGTHKDQLVLWNANIEPTFLVRRSVRRTMWKPPSID
jgi:hypothetical protein